MLTIASTPATLATMSDQPSNDAASTEAIDWLVGRMRWEHILRDLHDRAEGDGAIDPVAAILEPADATEADDADAA